MKRFLAFAAVCALCLVSAACAPSGGGSAAPETSSAAVSESASDPMGSASVSAEEKGELSDWGVTLSVTSASASGLSYVWERSGGTAEGELSTGSWYDVRRLENGEWTALPYQLDNVGWDAMAVILPEDGTSESEVDWEWLYGSLPAGEYQFVKEVMLFRDTGDYDKQEICAPFSVE